MRYNLNFFFSLSVLLFTGCSTIKPYQINCIDVSNDALYVVEIVIEGRTNNPKLETVKMDAINGIIYNGITGVGCISQKPLLDNMSSSMDEQKILNKKVKGIVKGYNRYITNIQFISNASIPNSKKYLIQSKYKLSVNKSQLIKDLVAANAIKPLSSNF